MVNDDSLAKLVHDINGKCANLKKAAGLLSGEASEEELEILKLMGEQARFLADEISAYAAKRLGERPK